MTLQTTLATVHTSSGVFNATWLLVAIPLFSAAILLIGGRRTDAWGHYLGVAAPLASFVLAVALFVSLIGKHIDGRRGSLSTGSAQTRTSSSIRCRSASSC
jgi:NADH-quinone oxidoreductase subunit L